MHYIDYVSIHASVKDATPASGCPVPSISFNPRICKRCDDDKVQSSSFTMFQSTHL